MKNYQTQEIGKLNDLDQHVFAPPELPVRLEGKVFLKETLGLTSMEASVNKDAPGTGINFFHRHKNNEELYIFLGGKGEMVVDGKRFPVEEGTTVRIPPSAVRAWWNTGEEDLYYIVVQAPNSGLEGSTLADGELVEGAVPWV